MTRFCADGSYYCRSLSGGHLEVGGARLPLGFQVRARGFGHFVLELAARERHFKPIFGCCCCRCN